MEIQEDINLYKAALTGAGVGLMSYITYGGTSNVDIYGMKINALTPLFIAGAGASVVADEIHARVLPHISSNQKLMNAESAAIGLGTSALTGMAILKLTGVPSENLWKIGVVSAAGYAAADYGYHQFLYPNSSF